MWTWQKIGDRLRLYPRDLIFGAAWNLERVRFTRISSNQGPPPRYLLPELSQSATTKVSFPKQGLPAGPSPNGQAAVLALGAQAVAGSLTDGLPKVGLPVKAPPTSEAV